MMKPFPIMAGSRESESRYVNAVGRRSGNATRLGPVVRDAPGQSVESPSFWTQDGIRS